MGLLHPRQLSKVTEADNSQVLTSTLVPVACVTRKAGAAERAASVGNAPSLASGGTGMTAILTGVGRGADH